MKNLKENLFRVLLIFVFITAGIFVSGCSDSTSPESGKGQIKITMIDAPAAYDEVNIVVTRVEVHKADSDSTSGWVVINNTTATYDLLTLRNGASVILGDTLLDAGRYTQIRLIIGTGSNIVVNGITYPLDISSGEQTGVKLNHEFTIESGLLYELYLDFDAEHSIVLTGNGQYKLKPVIRLVPLVISGSITGKIYPVNAAEFVFAISGEDTVRTIAEPITGSFMLLAMIPKTYQVKVFSANNAYNDTTISNVMVTARQNTELGTLNLSLK